MLTVFLLGSVYYLAVANFGVNANSNDSTVTLSIEMLDDTFVDRISVGDTVYDYITGRKLGIVESLEVGECLMPVPDADTDEGLYAVYPGYVNLKIQLNTKGYRANTKDGETVMISGNSSYKNKCSAILMTDDLQFTAKIDISVADKKKR